MEDFGEKKQKIVYESVEIKIDGQTGEVLEKTTQKDVYLSQEPNFVKLYVDCLLTFNDLSKSLNPVMLEILKRVPYANVEEGQVIYINKALKSDIAKTLNLKIDRINQSVTQLVKKDMLRRLDIGKYQVNPYLFGKGDWKDIKKIRATFDFNTGEIIADLKGDEI